jgi:hypothetical protein
MSARISAVYHCLSHRALSKFRKDTYALLKLNLLLNFAMNISPQRLALSDKDGRCKLFYGG